MSYVVSTASSASFPSDSGMPWDENASDVRPAFLDLDQHATPTK